MWNLSIPPGQLPNVGDTAKQPIGFPRQWHNLCESVTLDRLYLASTKNQSTAGIRTCTNSLSIWLYMLHCMSQQLLLGFCQIQDTMLCQVHNCNCQPKPRSTIPIELRAKACRSSEGRCRTEAGKAMLMLQDIEMNQQ